MTADSDKIEKMLKAFKDDIKDEFRLQLGIQSERFQHKLDVVVEGHQMLSEKVDRMKNDMDQRFECVEHKLDALAADLKAHRADTEAHKELYRVKEPEQTK